MPRSRDVVVVGAGIVGCAVAYELARRGASVHIVEEQATGMGATHASAGMLAPYLEAEEPGPFLDLTVRSLNLFDAFVARVEADSGQLIPYRRTGTLQTAVDEGGLRTLHQASAHLAAHGVGSRLLDASAVRAEEPYLGSHVVGGLVVPAHGFVAALELARALSAGARRHGARLTEGRRVRRVVSQADRLLVETDGGAIDASAVVLAAGSWSRQIDLAGVLTPVPVRPVRGQLLRLGWNGPVLRRVMWSDRCYLVPWDDGTLLVGATVEEVGFDERATVAGVRDLLAAVCDLLPHASTASFLGARVGLRPASPDLLPILGWSRACPNVMYATAHYRNGILLAPLTATLVADAVLDGVTDPSLAVFGPQRFGDL